MNATLLCWNVAGRLGRLQEQARLVIDANPDLICLQEITSKSAPSWIELLTASGWKHVALPEQTAGVSQQHRRALSALTAARVPLTIRDVEGVPWAERVLCTRADGLELLNVHSPISARPDLVKVKTHEAVHVHLAAGWGARAVCGDLNTPRKEHPDGRVWSFARTQHGKLRPERGERWDRAELSVIKGLEPYGFRDAFRELHGLEAQELSWEWPRWGGGYRLDHLVISGEVSVKEISYLHEWRKSGLSDHSPLYARLSW